MDQKKIGQFLKMLRKDKGLTQEQFADIMFVTNRTVSRWETGNNMPDLDLIIRMADFYAVEIREILDGERKDDGMKKEMEETILKVAEYSHEERVRLNKKMMMFFTAGIVALMIRESLDGFGLTGTPFGENLSSFMTGLTLGVLVLGVLYSQQVFSRLRAFKLRMIGATLKRQ